MRVIDIILATAGAAALAGGVFVFLNPPVTEAESVRTNVPLPLVETASVEVSDTLPSIRQSALLQATSEIVVTSASSGRVVWVNPKFQIGERIASGAPLLRLDTARLETDVARAEAEIAVVQAELTRLEEEFARISELVERNVSSEATLTTTRTSRGAAEARVALAEATLLAAQIAVEEATVYAPFDAVVTAETLALGQFLQPGSEVGRLVNADSAELVVRLNAQQLGTLGDTARLIGRDVIVRATDASGVERGGQIERIALTAETATQTTAVIVRVDNPFDGNAGVFRLNTLFEVELPIIGDALILFAIPAEAVQTGNRIWAVEDGVLREVEARIERRVGDHVLITSETVLAGTPILLTRLPNAIEGLRVRDAAHPAEQHASMGTMQ